MNQKQLNSFLIHTQPSFGLRARRCLPMFGDLKIIDDALALVGPDHQIINIGPFTELNRAFSHPILDLGESTLAPGLINAHTHLELSHLKEKTDLSQGFEAWVKSLLRLPMDSVEMETIAQAAEDLAACGTALVADITSRRPDLVDKALHPHGIEALFGFEFIGFSKQTATLNWPPLAAPFLKEGRMTAAGHALYSTQPEILRLAKIWCQEHHRPFLLHLAEHPGEVEFLTTGLGELADLLHRRLVPKNFSTPKMSPTTYADSLGLLDQNTLAVHAVHVDDQDMAILKRTHTSVCLCPRSNAAIRVGRAPWEKMFNKGIPLCLGTDSLASNADLNLWNEAAALLSDAQAQLSLSDLMAMLTTNPAKIFGRSDLGSLAPGKKASFSLIPPNILALF